MVEGEKRTGCPIFPNIPDGQIKNIRDQVVLDNIQVSETQDSRRSAIQGCLLKNSAENRKSATDKICGDCSLSITCNATGKKIIKSKFRIGGRTYSFRF